MTENLNLVGKEENVDYFRKHPFPHAETMWHITNKHLLKILWLKAKLCRNYLWWANSPFDTMFSNLSKGNTFISRDFLALFRSHLRQVGCKWKRVNIPHILRITISVVHLCFDVEGGTGITSDLHVPPLQLQVHRITLYCRRKLSVAYSHHDVTVSCISDICWC